jgi:hypothetical protein
MFRKPPHDNTNFITDNVFKVKYDLDGLFYPAIVLGVGPSTPYLSTSIVRFLNYNETKEVLRDKDLFIISKDNIPPVNQMLEEDIDLVDIY